MPVNPYVILSELTAVNVSALSKFAQVKDFKMCLFKRERTLALPVQTALYSANI